MAIENCLTVYTIDTWNAVSEKINRLNDFKPNVREFKRLFLNGATIVEVDSADRILIPKQLQEYAGIKKDAVLSAQGNKLELWDKDTYYNYLREQWVVLASWLRKWLMISEILLILFKHGQSRFLSHNSSFT